MMSEEKKNFSPNAFRVCVDSRENDIRGLVYSPLVEHPISYNGLNELMLKMDKVFDSNGYPQAFQEKRSFLRRTPRQASYNGVPEVLPESRDIFEKEGSFFTVDVVVESRRNTSWQGYVQSIDGTKIGEFKSDIELWEMFFLYKQE